MTDIGKILIICGMVVLALGLLFTFGGKIPYLGKLPGDILIRRENFTFYMPLTTSLVLSVILTVLFRLFNK